MTTLVIIHHLAFADSPDYASRSLKCEHDLSIEDLLEEVFEFTNIGSCREAKIETTRSTGRCYSTSCGDVVSVQGKDYIVCGLGFQEVKDFSGLVAEWKADPARGFWDKEARAYAKGAA